MSPVSDRIEKRIVLRAPRERVWRAISEARQFGSWFGVAFDGEFAAGARITGRIAPTQVDPEVAKMQQPYAGFPFDFHIERIEPMSLFSFRWHPNAVERNADYSAEAMTLVEFRLEDANEGTLLTITESGFDAIPLERRAKAFTSNEGGWTHQSKLIAKYLERLPS
ncbi:SRPBCC family protein [Paraburkholderia silviterrae]|uniref:Vanillate O-demethylase oxidoreductase VanB n=1 Tax=Paraburkholderia silviterrae TaxID=2528715 RepID=A0A4R5M815_9BURK|nr:SRPBCC family protein [Paraburkholderia silviterrae]TDG22012.1 vanillate O-demethylase oxidoreductase VanB [Paraburkholderia silviterrae]